MDLYTIAQARKDCVSTNVFSYSLDQDLIIWGSDITNNNDVKVVFLSVVWEMESLAGITSRLLTAVTEFKSKYSNAKIVVILNSWYKIYQLDISGINEICFIDYCLLERFNRVFNIGHLDYASTWNPDNDKFLVLTGKPDKLNRIRLLYLLKQAGLLDRATWSLFMPKLAFDKCHQLVPELSLEEFQEFVSTSLSSPDHRWIAEQPASFHHSGIPFDFNIYKNSKFQVVCESNFSIIVPTPWITEKTWMTILNHQPFIMAAEPGMLKKLKAMGFKTFEQYLSITDYDNITDSEQRLLSVVTNTKHWLDNISNYKTDIMADVEYNFQHFKNLAIKNIDNLTTVVNRYADISIHQVVQLYDPYQTIRWRTFYENIKGADWPKCDFEEQFYTLPAHVQQECIELFGYQPWKKA